MTGKAPKRPQDINQRAKRVVDLVTGRVVDPLDEQAKDPAAVNLGRRGGLKGGKARAEALSAERRKEIAKAAAVKRWKKPEVD